MCLDNKFKEFEKSLTKNERKAIQCWLGAFHESICCHQITRRGSADVAQYEQDLGTALTKAVICQKIVYRGLSAGNWRPDKIKYLKELIEGPATFKLPCHGSASMEESIGRGFTFTEPNDEERNLAVLLKVQPKTARYLAPFQHKYKDEKEVVLLRGSTFRRISKKKKPDLEFWELDIEEIIS